MKKLSGISLLILSLAFTGCFKKKLPENCAATKTKNTTTREAEKENVICQEKEYMMSEGCLNLGCKLSKEEPRPMAVTDKYELRYANLAYLLCEKLGGKIGIYEYMKAGEWNTTVFCADANNQFVEAKYLEDRWQGYLSAPCHK